MCGRQTALYSPQWDVSYVNEIFRIIFSFIICHVIILVVPAVSFLCVIPHRLKSVNQNSDSWLQPWPGLPALGLRAEQAAGLMKPSLTLSVQSLRFLTHALSNLTRLLCLFFFNSTIFSNCFPFKLSSSENNKQKIFLSCYFWHLFHHI